MTEIRSKQPADTYGAFLNDLGESNPKILSDEQVRGGIIALRNPYISDAEKNRLRNEVYGSVIRLIPWAINNSRAPESKHPEELVGEAFEVVDRCIENFDPEDVSPRTEEPAKFSTYVARSLREALKAPATTVDVSGSVPMPVHATDYRTLMRRAWEEFLQENQKEPNSEEWYRKTVSYIAQNRNSLATLRGMTPETFSAVKEHGIDRKYAQIGRRFGGMWVDKDTLGLLPPADIAERVPDDGEGVHEQVVKKLLSEDVSDVLASLTSRERRVLELRFGIGLNEDGKEMKPMTLAEVASVYGVVRETIRKTEEKAIQKLRNPIRVRKIERYLDEGDSEQEKEYRKGIDRIRDMFLRIGPDQYMLLLHQIKAVKDDKKKRELVSKSLGFSFEKNFTHGINHYNKPLMTVMDDIGRAMELKIRSQYGTPMYDEWHSVFKMP